MNDISIKIVDFYCNQLQIDNIDKEYCLNYIRKIRKLGYIDEI